MNTNDLPPAAKLAALIETGRAANPDLHHGHCRLLEGDAACALGFAGLAAGIARNELEHLGGSLVGIHRVALAAGVPSRLAGAVASCNDAGGMSLDGICTSLREGSLAKITVPA